MALRREGSLLGRFNCTTRRRFGTGSLLHGYETLQTNILREVVVLSNCLEPNDLCAVALLTQNILLTAM